MIYVGIDDTDDAEGGGTGRVAREIAARLAGDLAVRGVTRHQLLVDPRVPCTRGNSCKVIHVRDRIVDDRVDLTALADRVEPMLLPLCRPSSDPGLCVATERVAGHPFGRDVQTRLVTQREAVEAAKSLGVVLRGLGGTRDGIIGALAGAILAAGGDDGRFVEIGRAREVRGDVAVEDLFAAGMESIRTAEGERVMRGRVLVPERGVRPVLRGGAAVLIV